MTSSPATRSIERRRAARAIRSAESAGERARGERDGALGACADQQRDRFGAREVEPPVEKRAARELARRRQSRAARRRAARRSSRSSAGEPWHDSSTTSSPVYERGARMTAHERLVDAFAALRIDDGDARESCARETPRAARAARSSGATSAIASGPLTRMTPIALSPSAVATATIVSSARRALRPGWRPSASRVGARARGSVHELLLQDLEHVRHGPVQHEPRGQVEEHEREDERHEQHHLRLTRIAHRSASSSAGRTS